jgi:SOS-response transcriptional repressor LexA
MNPSFSQLVKTKRKELGLSQKRLGQLVGVTGTYIADMENFGKIPTDGIILKMAEFLHLDPVFFLLAAVKERYGEEDDVTRIYEKVFRAYSRARARGEIDSPPDEALHPDVEEAKLAQALRRGLKVIIADPKQIRDEPYRSMVKDIEQHVRRAWEEDPFFEAEVASGEPLPYRYTVPVISYVSAGEPIMWTDAGYGPGSGFEQVELPPGLDSALASRIYAVRVRGNSMFPYLKDGATLFVKPESRAEIRHGDYVIFKDQNFNAWVKMVLFRDGKIVLRSLNPEYEDMVRQEDDLVLMEKVIAITF